MKAKAQPLKPMGCIKNSYKLEVYSNTSIRQEMRKTSNKSPNLTPKATGKRIIKTPQGNYKNWRRNKF